jgi:hypothetical protein
MVDIKALETAGYSDEKLKAIFTQPHTKLKSSHPKAADLIDLHQSRMDDGISRSLDMARTYWAIDRAYDISSEQVTFSIARGLISQNASGPEVLNLAKQAKLDRLLMKRTNATGQFLNWQNQPCDAKSAAEDVHLPTFFQIYIPLVASYMKARWAKLFNDRNVSPLYKLEPSILSLRRKLLTRIITSRISRMSADLGYAAMERQSIHAALLYGICINFAEQDWLSEKHKIGEKEVTVKSGVPFVAPHPSRIFYDLAKPLSTLNTDSGVSYVGYWTLHRFSDIFHNTEFWNREGVKVDSNGKQPWRESSIFRLYQELYPCAAKFPQFQPGSDNDREDKAFRYTYSEHSDSAVDVTVMFHKLVPKDWGLYDYDKPVWHRFVYAGNTVIHVKPWSYCPAIVYQYDADGNRANPSGIGQELLPFQDHLGNLLSQYLLSVKKNLIRIVMTDLDVISPDDVKKISNESENALRGIAFIPVDNRELRNMGVDDARLGLRALQFPPQNTQEVLSAITALLTMVERALGFSPQEIGASASHQQSATEVVTISQNTSQRLQLTGSFIDEAMNARAKLLYEAMLSHDDDEVLADVAEMTPEGEKILTEAGFKIEKDGSHTAGVTGPKSALLLEGIGLFKDTSNRVNEPAVAQLMTAFLDRILSNPAIVQLVGPKFLFERLNEIAEFFQLPVDFRLPADFKPINGEPTPEQQAQMKAQQEGQQQQAIQAMQQIAAEVSQQVVGQAVEGLSEQVRTGLAEPLAQKQQQIEQALMAFMQQAQADSAQTKDALGQVVQRGQQVEQAVTAVAGQTAQNKDLIDQMAQIINGLDQIQASMAGGPVQVQPVA